MRVLHVVSADGAGGGMQSALFMPLLTRMPKDKVKAQLVSLAPSAVPSAVVRQHGVPVHDVAFSRRRFSAGAFSELLKVAREFRPDIIQAWGMTAQLLALAVRARMDKRVQVIWSAANTVPLPAKPGFVDRQKLKLAARYSRKADRIVFASSAGAAAHQRAGYAEQRCTIIPPGVDGTRFKADPAARTKVREQLELPDNAFVIGMVAPFQPEYDHATLFKAIGELIKAHPNIHLVLAGHGVQKGNAPLMALVGGGTLATHVRLLGEWSDTAALFNACDLVCSSALTDTARMTLVMAMLCGVPCVATGMGANGEVIGQFGVAIEPGSPAAFIRGITRVLEMPAERRSYMINGARKHALKNFIQVSSLQKYLQLYHEAIGRESLASGEAGEVVSSAAQVTASDVTPAATPVGSTAVPPTAAASAIDAVAPLIRNENVRPASGVSRKKGVDPVPPPKQSKPIKEKTVAMADLADPDSLETKETQERSAPRPHEDDVLVSFESTLAQGQTLTPVDTERARGVADDIEDLLAPEELQVASEANAPAASPPPSVDAEARSAAPDPEPALQLQLIPDEPPEAQKKVASS